MTSKREFSSKGLNQPLYASELDMVSINVLKNKKPLHVMMLGLRGVPNIQGGIESHVEKLTPLLIGLGCEVEVVGRSFYQSAYKSPMWMGARITRLWTPQSKSLEAIVHTFFGVIYAAIKRPDILHIHAIGPGLMTPLARLLGLNVVVTHHGPDYDRQKWSRFAKSALLIGEWASMKFSNRRIVISEVIRELVLSKHGVNSDLIFNGVNMPSLDVSEMYLSEHGLVKNKYILLVSRLVPEKRHLDLINAFNLLTETDYKLVLVGSSDHPDTYTKSLFNAASSNSNIVMTGFQTGEALRSLYSHAALFVLPSSHEGLSISLLEALSYGIPVLASDIPANLELGLNRTCYFELGNVSQLSKLLESSISNPMSQQEKAELRTWVKNKYNWNNIANMTYKIYQNVVK